MSESSTFTSSELSGETINYDKTVKLHLPKFSRGFKFSDFLKTFSPLVGRQSIVNLGRLRFPNEWIITVSSTEARNKLLRKGVTCVQGKKCVISPYVENDVCGKVHWLPADVPDSAILTLLRRFGDVSFFETEKYVDNADSLDTSVRFFVMTLKPSETRDSIPHFIKISQSEGLITIKGRQPMCFACRGDHLKVNCPDRKTEFVVKDIKKRKKRKKKSRTEGQMTSGQQAKPPSAVTEDIAAAISDSVLQVRPSSSTGNASRMAASSAKQKPKEPVPPVDANSFQNLMSLFSQRLVDALNSATESVASSQLAPPTNSAETVTKKKKKKKKKKKDAYDVTEVADAVSDATPGDVALSSHQIPMNDGCAAAADEPSTNPAASEPGPNNANVHKKSKKKKKKKSGAAATSGSTDL